MIIRLREYWRSFARRERRMIAAGAAVVVAALVFAIAVQPAWVTRTRIKNELPKLRDQLAEMEALRAEVMLLRQQGIGAGSVETLKAAAEQSMGNQGLAGTVRVDGERKIVISASAVPAANWFSWMEQFGREARMRITLVRIARASAPGLVDAEASFEVPTR